MIALSLGGALLTSCNSRPEDGGRTALLSLPYEQFDRTLGAGWRTLQKEKRNGEAAALIVEFLKRHRELILQQAAVLHFHAAQLLADEREHQKAIAHLKLARCDGMAPGYNEWADAMRAFLERDRNEVLAIRDRVAHYPPEGVTAIYQRNINCSRTDSIAPTRN